MSELEVRIVELPPMRVASGLGFGNEPEMLAWDKIFNFLKEKGMWEEMQNLEYYGFNNPDPSPGSPNYGYEQWVVVPEGVEGTEDVTVKQVPGGKYAVTRCEGIPNIHQTWQALVAWREDSQYLYGGHQWLEKWVNPTPKGLAPDELVMDLFMPIVE